MGSELFPKGSLVKMKSGGPTMIVFFVKDRKSDGAPMPKSLKNEFDDGGDKRACFWFNKNDDPVCTEVPVECLEEASVNEFDNGKL